MSRAGLTVIRLSKFSSGRQQKCSFCSAGGRKRRRRNKLPLAATKKDKIRSLEKKPEPTLPNMEDLKGIDFNKVGDTVESRLTQAQEWVYKFWRADGVSAGPRPERSTLNMNGQWWFWNVLLMAAPGISIALYCEFKAKPEMHYMLGKLDEEQRARILGETIQGEEEVFEMDNDDLQRIQESVNVKVSNDDSDEDENLSLLALKQRLDTLESQLYKKDKQLDHLRRYQLERTQQSGVQNRIEDKMIAEWKTQGAGIPAKHVEETTTDDDESLSKRMKEAIMHGLGENLEAKKEVLQTYSKKCLEYGRNLFSGEQKQPEEAKASIPGEGETDNKASSNDNVVKSVTDAASHANRAADIVSASVSSNDLNEMTQTAKEASKAAAEASKAAQAAAHAATQIGTQTEAKSDTRGFLSQQWNKWFPKDHAPKKDAADQSPE